MLKILQILFLAASGLISPAGWAQSTGPQSALPVYDAVAIKPNNSGSRGSSSGAANDVYRATNASMKALLVNAYGIRDGLISGLPGWAESARFDINAKITDYDPVAVKNLTPVQKRAMVAAMLVERFHLKTHIEVRQLPVYELVVAKGRPSFKANPAPAPGTPDPGKAESSRGSMSIYGSKELAATGVPMKSLVSALSNQMDRTVIDKTGLNGEYDFHLKWTPENAPQPSPDDAPPLLFTAIQEQLGLKLVAAKAPVDTLVVDHVEQPTEN